MQKHSCFRAEGKCSYCSLRAILPPSLLYLASKLPTLRAGLDTAISGQLGPQATNLAGGELFLARVIRLVHATSIWGKRPHFSASSSRITQQHALVVNRIGASATAGTTTDRASERRIRFFRRIRDVVIRFGAPAFERMV